jgi:hypothetical protein
MAAGTPLTRISLGAGSVADDLGYVALADLARALGDLTEEYRVIGGHMVTVSRREVAAGARTLPGNRRRRSRRSANRGPRSRSRSQAEGPQLLTDSRKPFRTRTIRYSRRHEAGRSL